MRAEQTDDSLAAVRVELAGTTAAHGALIAGEAHLRPDILSQASSLGGDSIWIEKVRVRTSPALDAEAQRMRSDALADLEEILAEAASDEAFVDALRKELTAATARMKSEVRQAEELAAVRDDRIAALIAETAPALLVRLEASEG